MQQMHCCDERNMVTFAMIASLNVAWKLTRQKRPFTAVDTVKLCMLAVSDKVVYDKKVKESITSSNKKCLSWTYHLFAEWNYLQRMSQKSFWKTFKKQRLYLSLWKNQLIVFVIFLECTFGTDFWGLVRWRNTLRGTNEKYNECLRSALFTNEPSYVEIAV